MAKTNPQHVRIDPRARLGQQLSKKRGMKTLPILDREHAEKCVDSVQPPDGVFEALFVDGGFVFFAAAHDKSAAQSVMACGARKSTKR